MMIVDKTVSRMVEDKKAEMAVTIKGLEDRIMELEQALLMPY